MSKRTHAARANFARVRCLIRYIAIYGHSESACLELWHSRFPGHPDGASPPINEIRHGIFRNNVAQRDLAAWQALDAAGKTSEAQIQNKWIELLGVGASK